ncbi:Alpha carbonic anhydrase [Macleaya cordata]|uniref:Carbonic anhydrase n=1 Tax=Macleaya cordata TaxID=56857 RepID=A0A200QHP1_MACCD|nr:Alpha carbonic anhydrase [Macleaya cordata]
MPTQIAIFILVIAITIIFAAGAENDVKFSYSGETGPDKWGSLSPSYAACSNGKTQSPINIAQKDLVVNPELQPLTRGYNNVNGTLIDNVYNIELLFGNGVGAIIINGKNYNLEQLHWHSPSEHTIDGIRYEAELHLVHKSADPGVSVIAILYRFGNPDPFLSQIKGYLDNLAKEVSVGNKEARIPITLVSTEELKRETSTYYRYIGSLTTPPCTEKVIWTVLAEVREISKEQVAALKAPLDTPYKQNSRPVQPLNERHVELYANK